MRRRGSRRAGAAQATRARRPASPAPPGTRARCARTAPESSRLGLPPLCREIALERELRHPPVPGDRFHRDLQHRRGLFDAQPPEVAQRDSRSASASQVAGPPRTSCLARRRRRMLPSYVCPSAWESGAESGGLAFPRRELDAVQEVSLLRMNSNVGELMCTVCARGDHQLTETTASDSARSHQLEALPTHPARSCALTVGRKEPDTPVASLRDRSPKRPALFRGRQLLEKE